MHTPYVRDDAAYTAYYMNQAGGDLNGFIGARTQYGSGIAGIFRSLYRMAIPLLKRGVNIAKPHLKTAVKNIAGEVMSNITRSAFTNKQDGDGLAFTTKRGRKRPPGTRSVPRDRTSKKPKTKRRKTSTKNSFGRGSRTKSTRSGAFSVDIFK